jgi:Rrf2 family iron-sulfur cluster assembly transcriptional regulator
MLNRSSMYGLRIMAVLSTIDDAAPLKASEIAARANIPAFYLSKVLRRMVEHGLLSATKGHGGGFQLTKKRNEITFADVLKSLQGKDERPVCVFGLKQCSDKTPCMLHHQWAAARAPFEKWARETTLADISNGTTETPKKRRQKKSPSL